MLSFVHFVDDVSSHHEHHLAGDRRQDSGPVGIERGEEIVGDAEGVIHHNYIVRARDEGGEEGDPDPSFPTEETEEAQDAAAQHRPVAVEQTFDGHGVGDGRCVRVQLGLRDDKSLLVHRETAHIHDALVLLKQEDRSELQQQRGDDGDCHIRPAAEDDAPTDIRCVCCHKNGCKGTKKS